MLRRAYVNIKGDLVLNIEAELGESIIVGNTDQGYLNHIGLCGQFK